MDSRLFGNNNISRARNSRRQVTRVVIPIRGWSSPQDRDDDTPEVVHDTRRMLPQTLVENEEAFLEQATPRALLLPDIRASDSPLSVPVANEPHMSPPMGNSSFVCSGLSMTLVVSAVYAAVLTVLGVLSFKHELLAGVVVCVVLMFVGMLYLAYFGSVDRTAEEAKESGATGKETSALSAWYYWTANYSMLAFGLATVVFFVAFSSIIGKYYAMTAGQAYEAVQANQGAQMYLDASLVKFDPSSSRLATEFARGYRHGDMYCVAPILPVKQPAGFSESSGVGIQGTKVNYVTLHDSAGSDFTNTGFWAVGKNCCSAAGSFTCNEASSPSARGGIVLQPGNGFGDEKDAEFFKRAISLATVSWSAHPADLSAPNPSLSISNMAHAHSAPFIMMTWVSEPEQYIHAYYTQAMVSLVTACALGFVFFLVLGTLTSYTINRQAPSEALANQLDASEHDHFGHHKAGGDLSKGDSWKHPTFDDKYLSMYDDQENEKLVVSSSHVSGSIRGA